MAMQPKFRSVQALQQALSIERLESEVSNLESKLAEEKFYSCKLRSAQHEAESRVKSLELQLTDAVNKTKDISYRLEATTIKYRELENNYNLLYNKYSSLIQQTKHEVVDCNSQNYKVAPYSNMVTSPVMVSGDLEGSQNSTGSALDDLTRYLSE